MKRITLYHASSNIIETPVFGKGKEYNDYGHGFYCTEHISEDKIVDVANSIIELKNSTTNIQRQAQKT